MWELDHKESWALKNWCFWTVVLEKTLESPLDCKEIKPLNPKGNESWIFIGRTDAEAETPKLWLPDVKNWLTGKDSDAKKDWRQEKKGKTEDEMVEWHYWLDGHAFEQVLGVGDGQGSLACCSPWGRKELDTTELNRTDWTELSINYIESILYISQNCPHDIVTLASSGIHLISEQQLWSPLTLDTTTTSNRHFLSLQGH